MKNWYTFLVEMGHGPYNPPENLLNRFGWGEDPIYDHPALSRDDVTALLDVATDEERFLLLALAGWGLRPVEACELHVGQLELDTKEGDILHIAFEAGQRKNARRTRKTVELLVGVDAIEERIDTLAEDDGWTGYLLPRPVDRAADVHADRASLVP